MQLADILVQNTHRSVLPCITTRGIRPASNTPYMVFSQRGCTVGRFSKQRNRTSGLLNQVKPVDKMCGADRAIWMANLQRVYWARAGATTSGKDGR